MATIPVSAGENFGAGDDGGNGQFVRVIVADTQAIFRAGLRKIFALEDDIRVVGQAETLAQTQSAVAKFSADVLIFEASLYSESGGLSRRTASSESQVANRGCDSWRRRRIDAGPFPARRAWHRVAGSRAWIDGGVPA